ncbi:hypothetical protein [Allocoleopsis sp.]
MDSRLIGSARADELIAGAINSVSNGDMEKVFSDSEQFANAVHP